MTFPTSCQACGSNTLDTKGFGTEQVEQELNSFFPSAKVARMDLDSTRGKHAYAKIIHAFENQDIFLNETATQLPVFLQRTPVTNTPVS